MKNKNYILVANTTQGMALHYLLDEAGIKNQVTAVPRTPDLKVPCGLALLIEAEDRQRIYDLAREKDQAYEAIIELAQDRTLTVWTPPPEAET